MPSKNLPISKLNKGYVRNKNSTFYHNKHCTRYHETNLTLIKIRNMFDVVAPALSSLLLLSYCKDNVRVCTSLKTLQNWPSTPNAQTNLAPKFRAPLSTGDCFSAGTSLSLYS